MALSNRYTSPLSVVKPADPIEEETDIETPIEETTGVEPISEQVTAPFKSLAVVVPPAEPFSEPDPAELNPSLFAAEADTNPGMAPAANYNYNQDYNYNPYLPVIPPAEPPLYLRNPGPPPKLPRNRKVTSLGRTSYRFQEVRFGYTNRRTLLYICAVIGIILLFVIIVIRPQNRKVENTLPLASAASTVTLAATPTPKPAVIIVPSTEQFAVVTATSGLVLEEPRVGAAQIQTLSQFTYIAFQRKSEDGWYQLKGGAGWIKASSVQVFATEKAAWDFKNSEEAKIKG
jgi:hypothetical protein